ncbi:hypothetical protein CK203_044935 [Vitis vinifera]|uniref:Uncharacterized protein n=1 Tax=Vitis vinifera TaxID=29760 RepID=A0A438HFE3_VITVI|nr:hypothetical protein CK203_044935 [Vitis vinifera]
MQGVYPDRESGYTIEGIQTTYPGRNLYPVAANLHLTILHPAHDARMGDQTSSKDVFPEDERLNLWFLGVKEARMTSQPKAKGEMYILNDGMNMKAKIVAMERRLEELEMNQMQEVQAISQTPLQAMPCAICLSYEHLKPQPPQYQQPTQAPQQASNLEQAMMNLNKVMGDFVEAKKSIIDQVRQEIDSQDRKMDGRLNDLSQKTDNLEYTSSRFANLNAMQEKETFLYNLIKIKRVSMK